METMTLRSFPLVILLALGCGGGGAAPAADGLTGLPNAHPDAGAELDASPLDLGPELGAGGAGGQGGGAGGAGGAPACLSANAQGFAFNVDTACATDGGERYCYAGCTLNGAHYVGCIVDSTPPRTCVASCSACAP
jgi:hypothetical protein